MSEIRALLLTDVVDSTRLTERLGDAAMAGVWTAHDRVARDLLAAWRGREIDKSDGMLLLFDCATDAAAYALAYHQALGALPVPLRARAGLHVGPVILRENSAADIALGAKPLEVDGVAKPTAARVMALAQGGQTFLTVDARRALGEATWSVQSHGNWVLKGVAEPVEIFEIGAADAPFGAPVDSDKVFRVARVGERWLPLKQVPNNLPQQPTRLIGRHKEIDEVKLLLGRARLVTLTGIGGCGKTRLSLQVAAELLPVYPDGVWMVELAALRDPALVPQAVASVLHTKEAAAQTLAHTLLAQLADKRLLLVLDNAEHLLDACVQWTDAVLRQCPLVTTLVSSREVLGVAGELVYRVPSLSLPDLKHDITPDRVAPYEAVRLFIERAQAHSPHFTIDNHNAPALASICHRLDGIPLAIELAAARARSLSLIELNARLDHRFRLLTGGSRAALPRQQTLRALIDWSHDLLSLAEQRLLGRLSVFAGGWTLQAAEHACSGAGVEAADVLDVLTALTDKSLVVAEHRSGDTRFRLLETVREYAHDRLTENEAVAPWKSRHLAWVAWLAAEADLQLRGAHQQQWMERLETEHDNVRAALGWSCTPSADVNDGLRIADALFSFWYVRGHYAEARRHYQDLLAVAPEVATELRAGVLACAGVLAAQHGDYASARRDGEAALAIQRELKDQGAIASSLLDLGSVDFYQGDLAAARRCFEEGLAIRRELGNLRGVAAALHNLAAVRRLEPDLAQAWALLQEALQIHRQTSDQWGVGLSLSNLGSLALDRADPAAARTCYDECLPMQRALGDRRGIAESLEGVARVVFAEGRPDRAVSIWGAAERLRDELGLPMALHERTALDQAMAPLRAACSQTAWDAAWQAGRAMTLEQAIDAALAKNAA